MKGSLLPIITLLILTQCGGTTPSETAETADLSVVYLNTAIGRLADLGCITDDALTTSLEEKSGADPAEFEAFVEGVRGEGLCDTGATLLIAIAKSAAEPYFEEGRILFDAGADDCVESLFSEEDQTIVAYDADEDGCLDRLSGFGEWLDQILEETDAELIAGSKMLTREIADSLQSAAESILIRLFPLLEEDQENFTDYDFETYREEAPTYLDALRQNIFQQIDDTALAEKLSDFVESTRSFVEEFGGCNDPGPSDDGLEGVQKSDVIGGVSPKFSEGGFGRIYLYVTEDHGWLGMEKGDKKYTRGFYKGTRGDGKTAGQVPESSSSELKNLFKFGEWLSGIENPRGPGYVTENDKRRETWCRICWSVTTEEWDKAVKGINGDINTPPGYDFFDHNCLGWSAKILKLLAKALPKYTNWGTPDPGVLYKTCTDLAKKGDKPEGADVVETKP